MSFQKTVNFDQGFGLVGEFAFSGPHRAQPGVLNSADPANNVIGRWFTRNEDGTFSAGGTGIEGGILAMPKSYVSNGTMTGGTLAPTLTLKNSEVAEFVFMGEIVIHVPVPVEPGYTVQYETATGRLTAAAPGTDPATGFASIPNAVISRYAQSGSSGGLAVVRLTN